MEVEAIRRFLHERAYAMKKHHATRLHYDLRLEWNGVLLSWAIPDGPSYQAGLIRQAIQMEDHRKANILFEGVHETGPIMVWDKGAWEPHSQCLDIESSLREGRLRFTLRGEKLKGEWTLARVNSTRNAPHPTWTLCKQADSFARSAADKCILEELPNSVISGMTMDEIVRHWERPAGRSEKQPGLFD
jgi:bifunctional non-homologous end joining protein LigD